jgi:polyphosphate kinase
VFHGVVGPKTPAKLALIVRQDPDGKIRRYAHLGTGNYNPSTARFCSDLSLFTSDEAITSAVDDVFNYLTAYAEKSHYKPLLVAPKDMARTCIQLIEREARHARRGRPARIIAKCNAVVDPPVIRALYRASQAGVEIDLIVRGQCTLVPGLRVSAAKFVCEVSWVGSWSTAASFALRTEASRKYISAARIGCPGICTSAWKCFSR